VHQTNFHFEVTDFVQIQMGDAWRRCLEILVLLASMRQGKIIFKIAENLPSTEKRGIHFSAEDQSA